MSKRKTTQEQEVIEAEVIETQIEDVEEPTTETVEAEKESKLSKAKTVVKKAFPFIVGAGAVLAAFLIGKSSGNNDEAYLAALQSEYGDDGDSDNSDKSDDSSDDSDVEVIDF